MTSEVSPNADEDMQHEEAKACHCKISAFFRKTLMIIV